MKALLHRAVTASEQRDCRHENRRPRPALATRSAFAGFRFLPDVIVLAVGWYLRFGLSYRDVEELLADRGIEVDHVTIYRWVLRFTQDGTTIAFDRLGDGPPVVLVCGGSTDRTANAGLAAELARDFTVYNYDRRGRGDSGDAQPYAVEREVEDIRAVIEATGGTANLYGTSSGAALAMEATASGLPITKLAMWEPPYSVRGRPDLPDDTASVYRELVEAGRRGDAVEYFMAKVVGLPPQFVAGARQAPFWAQQEALAHTLAYDATIMGDYSLPTERARAVPVPTIIIDGGASFGSMGRRPTR